MCVHVCMCVCVSVWYLDRKCEYELIIDFIISAVIKWSVTRNSSSSAVWSSGQGACTMRGCCVKVSCSMRSKIMPENPWMVCCWVTVDTCSVTGCLRHLSTPQHVRRGTAMPHTCLLDLLWKEATCAEAVFPVIYKYLTFHLAFSYTFPFSASCIPNPVRVYTRLGHV